MEAIARFPPRGMIARARARGAGIGSMSREKRSALEVAACTFGLGFGLALELRRGLFLGGVAFLFAEAVVAGFAALAGDQSDDLHRVHVERGADFVFLRHVVRDDLSRDLQHRAAPYLGTVFRQRLALGVEQLRLARPLLAVLAGAAGLHLCLDDDHAGLVA